MLSMPEMTPLAMAGTEPMTITKKMACSLSWNSATASGIQAVDGIVCRPVMSEPMADRTTLLSATITPSTVPITTEAR